MHTQLTTKNSMETITASCPKCSTEYQLTQEQLSVANGQVRCGACMNIFQAVETATSMPLNDTPDQPHKSQFINDDDATLIINADMREQLDATQSFDKGEFSSSFQNLNTLDDNPFATELDNDTGSFDNPDESWAEQLLADADIHEDNENIDPIDFSKDASTLRNPDDQPLKALGSTNDDFDELDLNGDLSLSQSEQGDLGFKLGNEKGDMLERITPEPLEFSIEKHRTLLTTIALSLFSACAVCSFIFQIFFFQFNDWSRTPEWRSLYMSGCKIFGCELPDQFNIEDISAKHLTVKSHAFYEHALVVDAIVTNHADIAQPLPNLELFFTNTNQDIIAARRFLPNEYLNGEMADTNLMPSRHPVHFTLEINDPSNLATGYWIQLSY